MLSATLQKQHDLSVLVCVPSDGMWHEPFGKSLCVMLIYCAQRRIGFYKTQQVSLFSAVGSILSNKRISALKAAKEQEVDYLLWTDSDQSFPKETLHNLIMAGKDVIGANIATKMLPTLPTARRKPQPGESAIGTLVWTPEKPEHRYEKVWRLGCGLTLMSKKAIAALPLNCFEVRYKPEVEFYQGEDWQMCEALEAAGIEIWIDHELSNRVGHHGTFNFTHEYNGLVKEEAA